MQAEHAYKILQLNEWELLKVQGHFKGSSVDRADGYIHLSGAEQVQGTLDKHYIMGTDLVIAQVAFAPIIDNIKFEVSRGGEKFPHLYADLPLSAVTAQAVFKANARNKYTFDLHHLVNGDPS